MSSFSLIRQSGFLSKRLNGRGCVCTVTDTGNVNVRVRFVDL